MRKTMTIVADTSQPMKKHICAKCGSDVILDAASNYCPFCGESLESSGEQVKANVMASIVDTDNIEVQCNDCKSVLSVYNSDRTSSEFVLSHYCPVCGGTDLEDSIFTDSACTDESCDVEAENEDIDDNKEDKIEETQDDVKESLESPTLESTDLTWKSVDDEENGKEGTLVAFSASSGNPLFIFRKKNCNDDMKSLFGSSLMIQAFNQICDKEGIGNAVAKFGGKAFNSKQILESNYIDTLVDNKIKNSVIPKFIECMALAVEGAMKGIYPDLRKSMNDSMCNELQGAGLPYERVQAAVKCTFGSGACSTIYSSILAKAMELFNKSESNYSETKSIIASAENSNSTPMDDEQMSVRAALNASTMSIVTPSVYGSHSSQSSEVSELRQRLKFSRI